MRSAIVTLSAFLLLPAVAIAHDGSRLWGSSFRDQERLLLLDELAWLPVNAADPVPPSLQDDEEEVVEPAIDGPIHGPTSMGGQVSFDRTTRETDTPLSSFESTVSSLFLSFFMSQYMDPELMHEVGLSTGITLSIIDSGLTDTSTLNENVSIFYRYNMPAGDSAKWFVGAGMAFVIGASSSGPGTESSTVEVGFDLSAGFRVFLDESTSVDTIFKYTVGAGADDDQNSTSITGFNILVGYSFYFSE